MKRYLLGWAALAAVVAPAARAQAPAELARTAAYAAGLQNPDGGFAPAPGQASSLGSTSSAVRVLKNTGGSIPDVARCIDYVKSCADRESGGFAPTPGGKPDVGTTASGLMAVAELKIPAEELAAKAVDYFSKHVKTFEEIRIAVAGLEAVRRTSPDFKKWTEQVEADRNPDGTWGGGAAQARATGGAAVALLRMGVKLDSDRRGAVLDALRNGQRSDGGWGKGEGDASDLESTYRVMRCFYMLGERPDLDRLGQFLAHRHRPDGSYSVQKGAPPSLGATYFATTVLRWVRLLSGEPPIVETAGFRPLFNGKDLSGWEGDTSLWSARDGMLVGTSPGLRHNDFLATEKSYGDFILKLTFRMHGDESSNSGVQFRSVRIPGHEMSGYQADIGQGYWGALYDESRRNKVLAPARPEALKGLNKSGWNTYEIRAVGDHITLRLNGIVSVDYHEPDPKIARDGKIAVQLHAGGPLRMEFKDIYIQELPGPTADDPEKPGFHVRKLKTARGERPYTMFVPNGYDGRKALPVVLFLHGAAERGQGGVDSARVGLGAAIAGHPDDYPLIAVFPQAEKTWAADSDDARAALAALDDVLKSYRADPDRVILTGISMGGHGAWEIAATHPERFAAVVPICGGAPPDRARALKDLPVWSFVGDADRDQTVLNMRALNAALREAGASPRMTEYRAVGRNSWDRAYNDPSLITWMLARSRH